LQVISNPFDDIVPRDRKPKSNEDSVESKKLDKKGTKFVIIQFSLNSFIIHSLNDEVYADY